MELKNILKLKSINSKTYVFDLVRKKYVRLLPEELVRQLCIQYLIKKKSYSTSLLQVEKMINFKTHIRRFDILARTSENVPFLLVECKSPKIKLDQSVLTQIAQYNMVLKVPYLLVTNGLKNYCFSLNSAKDKYINIDYIPSFNS